MVFRQAATRSSAHSQDSKQSEPREQANGLLCPQSSLHGFGKGLQGLLHHHGFVGYID